MHTVCILPVAVIDMQPLLTKSAPTFVNIYGELPVEQKEVGTYKKWATVLTVLGEYVHTEVCLDMHAVYFKKC